MKYTSTIGVITALAIVATCFMPWVFIPPIQLMVTGLNAGTTHLGKPGLVNIFMSVISIILFILPSISAKRINLFVGVFNLAWAIRNYFIVTLCQMGDCPEKKIGIYLLVILSIVLLLMTFFPKVDLNKVSQD